MSDTNAFENANTVAIIGMAGRFPGARTLDAFWQNLRDGVQSLTRFSDEELAAQGIPTELLSNPQYVKAKPVLEDIDLFDAAFFDFNPREAELTDPQQRIFLECAWEALEDAGCNPATYQGAIGVYAGVGINSYLLFNLLSIPGFITTVDGFQALVASDKDYLTSHVSYKLNLRGPSVTIQTSCSTSLVAVHLACQGLLNGECDMALAGGISVSVPQKAGYLYQAGGILSPDGHCRPFDAQAQGAVFGSGVGLVALKRLADALADRDQIYAVIKGSAINNDGALKVGFTAPAVAGQAAVIATAQAVADVSPDTIAFVEAHGTATPLGDPIEMLALTQAFRARTNRTGFCALGSVKANIGHLDVAAGVAGLIKTVLALQHHTIPATLHFTSPNPQIPFATSPFFVPTQPLPWPPAAAPRRAGVSSFGFGGTNAHVIVEEAPHAAPAGPTRPHQLLPLSAKTPAALDALAVRLATFLAQHPAIDLADVAYTLWVGRAHFRYRRSVSAASLQELQQALSTATPPPTPLPPNVGARPVAMLFPGQGTQQVGMANTLYLHDPTVRYWIDWCSAYLAPLLGCDLRALLYPPAGQEAAAEQRLAQTALAQPALFVVEYALAQFWRSWGVLPQALLGHSLGEYVAACLAEVFSLEDALTLVARRGQLMQDVQAGVMLAVPLSVEELRPLLDGDVDLAAENSPQQCVVAGPEAAITALAERLAAQKLEGRQLASTRAFHSRQMDAIVQAFTATVAQVRLRAPQIPVISNVSGSWLTADEAQDPAYWGRQLRAPVQFRRGAETLLGAQEWVLVEAGVGRSLGGLLRQQTGGRAALVLRTLERGGADALAEGLAAVGQAWVAGVAVTAADWYRAEERRRVHLPTYPFQRQRFWIEPAKQSSPMQVRQATPDKKPDIADWFYLPVWKSTLLPANASLASLAAEPACWLIFNDEAGYGSEMAQRLERAGQRVICVASGEQWCRQSERRYTLRPDLREDYSSLIGQLRADGYTPDRVVHLWSVTANGAAEEGAGARTQALGFYSLLFLAQALGEMNSQAPLAMTVLSTNVYAVTGAEALCPTKATLLGPCNVIPQEYPHISCRHIDVTLPAAGSLHEQQFTDRLLAEIAAQAPEPTVAFRGNQRWRRVYEPVRIARGTRAASRLRQHGVYLITGGLGGLGLALGEHLATTFQAKLVLVGRTELPARAAWPQWLAEHDDQDRMSTKIRRIAAIEQAGGEVLVTTADVTNHERMQAVMTQTLERFGALHGVIHAAGAPGAGLIQLKTPDLVAPVFAPKIDGTLVLERIIQGIPLDFLVLFSSTASVVGGFGLVDYSAANAFLDAFAHDHTARRNIFTVAIDWSAWQWDDWQAGLMAAIAPVQLRFKKLRELLGITFQEGMDAFERIVSNSAAQLIVSTQDFGIVLAEHTGSATLDLLKGLDTHLDAPAHPRPDLDNQFVAPRSEIEQTMTVIWQELLGIAQAGVHDNFLDLGGHSLLAVQLVSRIREAFQLDLPMRALFEAPTIAELSSVIAASRLKQADRDEDRDEDDDLAQLLAEIERLSPEELDRKLAEERGD